MKTNYIYTLFFTLLLGATACKKDKTEETTDANYIISVTGGVSPNQTSYLLGTKDFPTGSIGTSTAIESASSAFIFKYGKSIYQNNFGAPATLKKYQFDASGNLQETGSFAIPGLRTIGAVSFVSETEAYATVASFGSTPKLVRFNPSTMAVTRDIDISGLFKTGATEIYLMGIMQQGNYLFIGVNYQNASFQNLENKVFVAVFDRSSGAFVKLISDERSNQAWNGGSESSFQPNVFAKTANGDVYVMGYAANGKPSGVLRIKNGETSFDPDYFFNLSNATGGPCLGLFHFDSGQTFTIKYTSTAAYPFDSGNAFAGQYIRIDLANKMVSGALSENLPLVKGNKSFMTKWDNEKIYFNVAASAENAIYSYSIKEGSIKKEFGLASGACNGFAKIQ
ncbi:DUF4374 domain-containing protein [Desertivirga brevis]|uniref:DUF4374 domain-containing protein n=1 Tax=Desertivirga brevis TaxID=2810310 RepID=UPI001A97548C|nr:DUF4374 domain-containing protein [Pedobacter sp. SYSU D00873]